MTGNFSNPYYDAARARAYSALGAEGTYYLAYRDLPEIFARQVTGKRALDFGCGAGRSTRFLADLGFQVVGVDISADMLAAARERDPAGDYRVIPDGDFSTLGEGEFDLVTAIYPFDSIPGERKVPILAGLRALLSQRGRIVVLVARPETYRHEWLSFSTREFPENRSASDGDVVRVVVLDMPDARPVEDILWSDEAYRECFRLAGLELIETCRPLGRPSDPCDWVTEAEVAPWTIYVLGPERDSRE